MEILGKLADTTNGSITRVDIHDMENQFQNLLKENIIATGVELSLHLHMGLKFRNENISNLSHNKARYFKHIGNVTEKTQYSLIN